MSSLAVRNPKRQKAIASTLVTVKDVLLQLEMRACKNSIRDWKRLKLFILLMAGHNCNLQEESVLIGRQATGTLIQLAPRIVTSVSI
jgi:hypothetical protein